MLIEMRRISPRRLLAYLVELDSCASRRKFLEKDVPIGRLVLSTDLKLKSRIKNTPNDVSKEYNTAVKKVIYWKASKGTGRRICIGGTIDDLR